MGSVFDRGARGDRWRSEIGETALGRTFTELIRLGWQVANSGDEERSSYPRSRPEGATLTMLGIDSGLCLEADPMVWKDGTHDAPNLDGVVGEPLLRLSFRWVWVFTDGQWVNTDTAGE